MVKCHIALLIKDIALTVTIKVTILVCDLLKCMSQPLTSRVLSLTKTYK